MISAVRLWADTDVDTGAGIVAGMLADTECARTRCGAGPERRWTEVLSGESDRATFADGGAPEAKVAQGDTREVRGRSRRVKEHRVLWLNVAVAEAVRVHERLRAREQVRLLDWTFLSSIP